MEIYKRRNTHILKSLVLFNQEDQHTHQRNDEFIFWKKILVCPILEPNAKGGFSLRNLTLVGKRDSLTIQQYKSSK